MTYDEIKRNLDMLADPVEKLEMVMDFGTQLPPVPAGVQCSDIVGCSSRVQICRLDNRFYAVADSALVRGIVAILIAIVDGCTPDEIRNMNLSRMFADLNINLGAGRLNGVNSMIRFLQNL